MASAQEYQQTVKVLIITDGKPGHVNQSLGLVFALQRILKASGTQLLALLCPPLSVGQCIQIGLGFANHETLLKPCSEQIERLAKNEEEVGRRAIPFGALDNISLVIGAGHGCHMTVLSVARSLNAKSIVLMKPSLPSVWFDFCLVPAHDKPASARHIIETQGAINRVHYEGQQKQLQLFLIGGPSNHYHWQPEKVLQQLGDVIQHDAAIEWQLVSSRRTPAEFVDAIKQRFPELRVIQPNDVSSSWLAENFPLVQQCWVSSDSVSMVYEALTAQARVGVIELEPVKKRGQVSRVASGLKLLSEAKLITVFSDWKLHSEFHPLKGDGFNQADTAGQELLARGLLT